MTKLRKAVAWAAIISGGFLALAGFFASLVAVWFFLGIGAAVFWLCGLLAVAGVALYAVGAESSEDEESGAPEGARFPADGRF